MEMQYSCGTPAVKISIVVPVHNDEEYLPTCLDSLVNQTLRDIEILVINDASTDNSLQIIEEYAARDSRIRVFSFPENQSAFLARNEGIRHASGEYIMFADGDDYLALNACERVWKLEQEAPVDILFFGVNTIVCGEVRIIYQNDHPAGFLYDRDVFSTFLENKIRVTLWDKAFRRELCCNVLSKCENLILPRSNDRYFAWIAFYLAQSYRGCPSEILYNHRFGLGESGAIKHVSLKRFEEIFCTIEWSCSAITRFIKKYCDNEWIEAAVKAAEKDRGLQLRVFLRYWGDMSPHDQPEALRLLLRYWSTPGDLGRIVGAFSYVFGKRQGELADLLAPILREGAIPVQKKPIRTVGTYYRHYANGGIQRVLSLTLPIWVRLGYRVVFLTDEEKENDYALPKGVIRVNCAVPRSAAASDYTERGEDWENLLRKHEIDVMVYHNPALWDTLLCRLMGIPVLTFFHETFDWVLKPSGATLLPSVARMGGGGITLTEMDRTFWRCVAPDMPVFLVKNPLTFDPADVQPVVLDGPPTILWAARLEQKQKRYLDPVEIMAEVVQRIPDAKLYLVGAGEGNLAMNELNSRITELGLEESVIPCGFQMDMASWYRKASVFLLTSTMESFCLGLAEALTFGLPVVMYELPYLTLVQGNAGIVSVPQLDITAAADAICELLENGEHRREVGRRGREFIENLYAGDEIAKQWQHIFASVGEPDAASEEPTTAQEVYHENLQLKDILQRFLKQYKLQLPVPVGKSGAASSGQVRFRYGDAEKQQYAALRTSGPKEKQDVSFVVEQDGQKWFNILLNSDGSRNWVTPTELKKAVQASSDASEKALKAKVAELTKLLQTYKGTLEELRKAFTGQTGEWPCVSFPYGDAAKQQYAELRASGSRDNRMVSIVSSQQDGKKRFNILLNSDGSPNWVTPEELKTLKERSGALEKLTEQLKQLQARYENLMRNSKAI